MTLLPFAVIGYAVVLIIICRVLAGCKVEDRMRRKAFNDHFKP